jgi:hypothetical protein
MRRSRLAHPLRSILHFIYRCGASISVPRTLPSALPFTSRKQSPPGDSKTPPSLLSLSLSLSLSLFTSLSLPSLLLSSFTPFPHSHSLPYPLPPLPLLPPTPSSRSRSQDLEWLNPCPHHYPHSARTPLHCYKSHCILALAHLIRQGTMARAPKSAGIALSLLLLAAAAKASAFPLLNSSLPDPAAVVADLHRYAPPEFRLFLVPAAAKQRFR